MSYAYRSGVASLTELWNAIGAGYRRAMGVNRADDLDVVCVHCGKEFRGELLAPDSEHAGLKCPHCRLFMPLERAGTDDSAASAPAPG